MQIQIYLQLVMRNTREINLVTQQLFKTDIGVLVPDFRNHVSKKSHA